MNLAQNGKLLFLRALCRKKNIRIIPEKPFKLTLINHNPLFLKGFIDEFISA
jgi:hypothetical protein